LFPATTRDKLAAANLPINYCTFSIFMYLSAEIKDFSDIDINGRFKAAIFYSVFGLEARSTLVSLLTSYIMIFEVIYSLKCSTLYYLVKRQSHSIYPKHIRIRMLRL
jgi:hypothetical protein